VEHGKYHVIVTKSQRYDQGHRMVMSWSYHTHSHSHRMWQRSQLMDMRTVGDRIHSHNSNCIYSIANLTGTLSSSLCQTLNKEQLAWFWLGVQRPLHQICTATIVIWDFLMPPSVMTAALKRAKGTISLAQAKDVVPGPNCMLKSLWGWIKNEGIKKRI